MSQSTEFTQASEEVKNLSKRPSNEHLLELYALFKQGTEGDVSGKRPGMLDLKGRAKFDSWSKLKGTESGEAQTKYIALVQEMKTIYG